MSKINKPISGNAGLYYVCYELSRLEWNVSPTSRNVKGVDVTIFNQSASKMHTIQVKTLSYRNPTGKITDLIAEYLIVVVLTPTPKSYAHKVDTELRAEVSQCKGWLSPKIYEQFKSIEVVIGRGNE